MIRKELCAIVGIKVPTFATHYANGDLPFRIERAEGRDGQGRTWSLFTVHDAARMLAARHLVDAQRMSWSEAAKILRGDGPGMRCGGVGLGHEYFDRDGIFVAQVQFANARTGEAPVLFPAQQIWQGPLDKIVAGAQSEAAGYSDSRKVAGEEIRVVSIVSVDLSHHYRLARRIAEQLGINVKRDHAVEPDSKVSE